MSQNLDRSDTSSTWDAPGVRIFGDSDPFTGRGEELARPPRLAAPAIRRSSRSGRPSAKRWRIPLYRASSSSRTTITESRLRDAQARGRPRPSVPGRVGLPSLERSTCSTFTRHAPAVTSALRSAPPPGAFCSTGPRGNALRSRIRSLHGRRHDLAGVHADARLYASLLSSRSRFIPPCPAASDRGPDARERRPLEDGCERHQGRLR